MTVAEELAKKYLGKGCGCSCHPEEFAYCEECCDSDMEGAINEALERAARVIEPKIGSLAVSRDRARAAGRDCVASCRQSDMETCERLAAEVRAMKSPASLSDQQQE